MQNFLNNQYSRRRWLKTGATLSLAATAGGSVLSSLALSPLASPKRVIFVFIPGGAAKSFWDPRGCGSNFVLPPMSAPLESIKQHCVFFNNLNMSRGGHGNSYVSLGSNFSPNRSTIDIALAPYLKQNTIHAQIHLAASASNAYPISRDAATGSAPAMGSPINAYHALFDGDAPATTTILDEHFAIAEPSLSDFDTQATLQSELAVLALKKNKTNIVTLMFGDSEADFYMPNADLNYHYAMSAGGIDMFIKYRAYLSQKFAYLVKLLEATPDSNNQSLLNSTLVVGVTDMGTGQDHTLSSAPFMLAGGKNFTRNGYMIDAGGYTHDDFLDTVAKLLGAPLTPYGKGPIPAVFGA